MVEIIAGLLVVFATPSIAGGAWQICVEDRVSLLATPVRAAVLREFGFPLDGQVARLEFKKCATGLPHMRLAIEAEAPKGLDGVLGLAYRRRDRIEPRLYVFHGPLVRYIGEPNNAHAIGRALARVAAHEAAHFLEQQAQHCESGLMRAVLPAYELTAKDRWPFRRSSPCRPDRSAVAQDRLIGEARTSRRDSPPGQRLDSDSKELPIR